VHVSKDQRFTCAQCGRCCRRATVAVSLAEAESYRSMNAERWSSGAGDPFVEIPGYPGLRQIRKREDGACVFLADDGRCRLHQELGFDRKPLSCRVFPFRFHPIESDVVVTSSFSCPTVVANEGTLLSTQAADLHALHLAWKREQPEAAATVQLVDGYPLPRPMLPRLRSLLSRILDVPGPDGSFDLVLSVRRVAAFLEDLSRPRVRKLAENDLDQYFDVMSRHAVDPETAPPARKASRLTRLVFRGFLLSAMSVQLHLEPSIGKRPAAIRFALFRLLAHLHGLGPGVAGFDLRRGRSVTLDLEDDAVREIATHYLRSMFETVGTGRRSIVDEIAMAVTHLNAACVFARIDAARDGRSTVDAQSFAKGLLESADLAQADDGGSLSRMLEVFSGKLDALCLFPASTI
jgi:Fe-S-cluster containining protein